ncbi:MAG: MaoC/PaaZ C-terminal domain-containing protein, partial [Actinomycetota bacterium]|nr:MaoC/PaaZ C-terminal domain-containing protein [Actinomycetota bacterium]
MKVGDRLPDLVRTITLTDMVAYGASTWDYHRLHYDHDFATRAGMERPVVDGQMFGALFAEQLTRSLDQGQRISRLFFRNTAPV